MTRAATEAKSWPRRSRDPRRRHRCRTRRRPTRPASRAPWRWRARCQRRPCSSRRGAPPPCCATHGPSPPPAAPTPTR
ncbi:MAG: hypothetical protein FJ137_05665 [Deltaproteobacteria bacterium]|nr:hypothetical protein [Deltaproteobacteria bacterium]